jgi:hypothetical protein
MTAKHVVLDENGNLYGDLAWRMNEKTNASDLILDQEETALLGGWLISSNADIACRFIGYTSQSEIKAIPVGVLLPQSSVEAGADVVVLGYPMGLRSEKYTTPILRKGIVALSTKDDLMLDAFVFPGNSGGPVLYEPTIKISSAGPITISSPIINQERLIGVVVASVEYTDVAISPQTRRPRITFEENSGLTHVVPADKILELMDRDDFKKMDN